MRLLMTDLNSPIFEHAQFRYTSLIRNYDITAIILQAVFSFDGCHASTPLSSDVPVTPTSDKQVSDTVQPAAQHISSHNGEVFEPVQSLSANDKGSGGETIIVTHTSSPTSYFLESHPESPLLEIKSPQC